MNVLGRVDECRFDVVCCFGGCFQKDQPVGLGKCLSFFGGHGPAVLEIVLVSDQHDYHIGLGVLARLLEPPRQVLEGVSPGYIVDQEGSCSASVIRPGDTSKGFLSGRIPDLQLHEFVTVQVHHSCTELDPDGQVVNWLESLVRELQQQTGLSNPCAIFPHEMPTPFGLLQSFICTRRCDATEKHGD
ncbi:unnamed protein product [Pseudo-nitzschia multistriata]|uniref:Uncharacterized protein n=1 Tax=Pseudo-nitzschia multistriata TaxID=183589 RepID=A0A448YUU7_9STRA|nr:unnamed protein product [Pseudo-nitzschia multistriata]